MIRVSVFYPNGSEKTFDLDYFQHRHIPLAVELLRPGGLIKAEVDQGVGTLPPGAPAPFAAAAHLYFPTVEAFQQAFAPHAEQLLGDIPNYTNIEPVLQIAEIVKD